IRGLTPPARLFPFSPVPLHRPARRLCWGPERPRPARRTHPAAASGEAVMSNPLDRRDFLGAAASAGVALGLGPHAAAARRGAEDKVVVGVMGTGGRGTELAKGFARQPGVAVAYVCDVDQGRVARGAAEAGKSAGRAPAAVRDFRRILDDKAVDVLV